MTKQTVTDIPSICPCCGEDLAPCRECGRDIVCQFCGAGRNDRSLCYRCNRAADEQAEQIAATDRAARQEFYRFGR